MYISKFYTNTSSMAFFSTALGIVFEMYISKFYTNTSSMAFFFTALGIVFDSAGQELCRGEAVRSQHMSSGWAKYWAGRKAILERSRWQESQYADTHLGAGQGSQGVN
jgi:hypothetical protein